MKLQDDGPIFTKQKVNFLPSDKILHLVVSSNTIVIAMANNILLRIDMKQPDKTEGRSSNRLCYFISNCNIRVIKLLLQILFGL